MELDTQNEPKQWSGFYWSYEAMEESLEDHNLHGILLKELIYFAALIFKDIHWFDLEVDPDVPDPSAWKALENNPITIFLYATRID